jgi:hypothetical protein
MEALESVLVASVVLVSVIYSVWRLTSARFHLRMIQMLGKAGGSRPWVARWRDRELSKLGGSCGTCAANVKLKVRSR